MTLRSAIDFKADFRRENDGWNPEGYCIPLAIDSSLPRSVLPMEYYDICKESNDRGGSYNEVVRTILSGFFGVQPKENDTHPIAKYDRFGGSPQDYFTYNQKDPSMYAYLFKEHSPEDVRLRDIVAQALREQCIVLFSNPNERGDHVMSISVIDNGYDGNEPDGILARCVVRSDGEIVDDDHVYSANDFAFGASCNKAYAPLPKFSRSRFPSGETSWELMVFPPDPAI